MRAEWPTLRFAAPWVFGSIVASSPGTDPVARGGRDLATARGPHGRSMSREDAEALALVAEMLGGGLVPA